MVFLERLGGWIWNPWLLGGFLLLGLYYSLRSGFFQVFECRLWLRATLGSLLVPDWTQIVAPLSCLADFTFNFLGTKKP